MVRCLAFAAALSTCLALGFSTEPNAISAETSDPSATLTRLIDAEIEAVWVRDKLKPAMRSGDEEFVRRVYLDVVGLPPTREEAREFIDDDRLGKRRLLIDRLLDDPRFGQHLADLWTPILRERGNDFGELSDGATDVLAVWLAQQFNNDVGFDDVITALVTAEGAISENPAAAYYALMGLPARSPNMGGLTSKHFAGIQIQCAECHDHPYEDDWTQESFVGMASFFTGIEVKADFYVQPLDPRIETGPIPPRALIEAYAKSPDLPPEALNRVDDLLTYGELRRLIRRVKPDIVHTHSSKAGIVGRAAAWAGRRATTARTGRNGRARPSRRSRPHRAARGAYPRGGGARRRRRRPHRTGW